MVLQEVNEDRPEKDASHKDYTTTEKGTGPMWNYTLMHTVNKRYSTFMDT